jgi:hypothetical protein
MKILIRFNDQSLHATLTVLRERVAELEEEWENAENLDRRVEVSEEIADLSGVISTLEEYE